MQPDNPENSGNEQFSHHSKAPLGKHAHRFIFGYIALIVLVAAVAGVYEWQHKKVNNLGGQVSSLNSQLQSTKQQVATLQAEVTKDKSSSKSTTTNNGTPKCSNADLTETTNGPNGGAAGNDYIDIIFTSRSSQACTLDGYPTVTMQDSSHKYIAIPSSNGGGMLLKDPGPKLITIQPDGTAVTGLSVTDGGQNCYTPAYILVTLPNQTVSNTLTAGSGDYLCTSFSITAIQAGSTPELN